MNTDEDTHNNQAGRKPPPDLDDNRNKQQRSIWPQMASAHRTAARQHQRGGDRLMSTTDLTAVDTGRMTRAQRSALPISTEVAQVLAEQHGVCIRPLAMRRIDTTTGRIDIVPVPCGSTRDDQCRPCADKARRLRMAQCRQGWHLDTEPIIERVTPTEEHKDLMAARADLVGRLHRMQNAGR